MKNRLAGKIAVVTGAGAGIGRGCALMFAEQGAQVIACDIDRSKLEQTRSSLTENLRDRLSIIETDLVSESGVASLRDYICGHFGQVDILLNAAAFAVFGWIEELSYTDWKKTLAGELDIVFLPIKALWPLLQKSGTASIINFASANAYHALPGSPALAHCAGKGGILAMTRQIAMEGAPHGIRANTISPGFILTEATREHLARDPGFEEKVLEKNMLKMLGEPEDIAFMATYLGSDEARYVTGADFSVDAGATAW